MDSQSCNYLYFLKLMIYYLNTWLISAAVVIRVTLQVYKLGLFLIALPVRACLLQVQYYLIVYRQVFWRGAGWRLFYFPKWGWGRGRVSVSGLVLIGCNFRASVVTRQMTMLHLVICFALLYSTPTLQVVKDKQISKSFVFHLFKFVYLY